MPFYKKLILVLVLVFTSLSCQKLLIKPDPTSDPERNFEIFWNDIHNGYPYMVEDKIDWKARYDNFRPKISSSTTNAQLYDVMTQMLSGFSDGHLSVEYNGDVYLNQKTTSNLIRLVRQDQSGAQVNSSAPIIHYLDNYPAINKSYIDPSTLQEVIGSDGINPNSKQTVCIYGLLKGQNIVYVNITTFLTDYSLAGIIKNIATSYPNVEGMVLDLRMNEGGNLGTMWDMMSVFAPAGSTVKYGYVKEKVGPLPENFGPEQYFGLTAKHEQKYLKPVVVLANSVSLSAAEHATMCFRQLRSYNRKIKIVGDYTFGATSFVVQRTLPCGIKYTLVNSKTWDINRTIVERTGVKPDEFWYLTPSIEQNIDEQIERAIQVINEDLF